MNPYYKNLEWTDYNGNVRHAIRTGLVKVTYGEDKGRSLLKNKQVHMICKMLESGEYTQREIAKEFNVPVYIIREIKIGNNWTNISKNYNIENCKLEQGFKYSDKMVTNICKDISKNKLTLTEIAKKYNIKYDTVLRIKNKKVYKYIVEKFDFSNFTNKKK